jgi:hypothetical protein
MENFNENVKNKLGEMKNAKGKINSMGSVESSGNKNEIKYKNIILQNERMIVLLEETLKVRERFKLYKNLSSI